MNISELEIICLAYSVDHYADGSCGNIWEVYAIPEGGLSSEIDDQSLLARDFTDGKIVGIIFPNEGVVDYKGPYDSDYDASEDAGFEVGVLAKKRGLINLGEIHSVYS